MKPPLMALLTGLCLTGCVTSDSGKSAAGPYDDTAMGDELVRSAREHAAQSGQRVLLVFGANWCADCRAMDALFQSDAAIAARLQQSFVLVKLDVGRDEVPRRNASLIARFGAAVETGIPVLVVVDADGTPLNDTRHERLADSDHRDPAKVLLFLDRWAK
jgi:protein disulfide-isomerase